jgi:hypothetical protein
LHFQYISKTSFLLFFVLFSSATAEEPEDNTPENYSIIDMIMEYYIDSVDDLVYPDELQPEKTVQQLGNIAGWIDIIGFNNLTMINGKYYIPGKPEDHVIIAYDKWETADGWNRGIDELSETVQVTSDNNSITASLDIYLKWHESTLKTRTINTPFGPRTVLWIKKDYHTETAIFNDTDLIPATFTPLNLNTSYVEVVIYNNSVTPKTTIKICNIPKNTLNINYTYNNESVIHYFGTCKQEYTTKNVPYMFIQSADIWQGGLGDDGNLTRVGDMVCLKTHNFSAANLTVSLSDPYNTSKINNITVHEVQWHGPEDTFSSLFWLFTTIICIFAAGIIYQFRGLLW